MGQSRAGLGDSYFNDRDRFRATSGLSIAAIVGVAVACVLDIATTAVDGTRYNVVVDYFADRAQDADLDTADNLGRTWGIAHLVGLVAAGAVFLVWWYCTHYNARWLGGPSTPGQTGGWVIGAWFCPIANLRFPRDMVADAWQASAPRGTTPSTAIINVWWLAFVLSNILSLYATRFFLGSTRTPTSKTAFADSFHTVAVLDTVSSTIYLGAAVLVIFIIVQLTRWQNTPYQPADTHSE